MTFDPLFKFFYISLFTETKDYTHRPQGVNCHGYRIWMSSNIYY